MSEICRKDLLARNMNRMLKLFPKDYNIFPRTWCLPAESVCTFHRDFALLFCFSQRVWTYWLLVWSYSAVTVTSKLTPGPKKTRRTSVSQTPGAKAKASSSPNQVKTFNPENTWSARFTSPGWGSIKPHTQHLHRNTQKKHTQVEVHTFVFPSSAVHNRRIQVRPAYLRAGDVMWPVQHIHVQGGTGSLLHH